MEEIEVIEDFYGVYLLVCINPKYKGRTYIGYTRDPERRLRQHNRGTWAGGAHKTNDKGPWKMVLVVHGFPNNISALRFEWAWQNPTRTTRLQHVQILKKIPRKETEVQYKIRILSELLRVGPWCRLPLIVRWLEMDFIEEFPLDRKPAEHITISKGEVRSCNTKRKITQNVDRTYTCFKCKNDINNNVLECLNTNCKLTSHLTCLADTFLTPGEYVPIEGNCPLCGKKLKWGDLIKKMNGFLGNVLPNQMNNDDEDSEDEIVCSQDKMFVDNNSYWLKDDEYVEFL